MSKKAITEHRMIIDAMMSVIDNLTRTLPASMFGTSLGPVDAGAAELTRKALSCVQAGVGAFRTGGNVEECVDDIKKGEVYVDLIKEHYRRCGR
jgi:hypothetical protein